MSEPEDNQPSTADDQDAAKQGGIDADVARGIREAAAAFRGLVQET